MDVIFDIDGTLADIAHRRHYVQSKPKNWTAFIKASVHDTPNYDIVWMLKTFHNAGCRILIATGRSELDRKLTENWLHSVAGIGGLYVKMYMRPINDFRQDSTIKSEILDQMYVDGFDPKMAVDDRDQVVQMWRQRGVRCLQVADGNF
jgi:hypothetical protein